MNSDYLQTADFLETVQYMTIAVVQPDGKPWSVPVRVHRREGLSFYWDSSSEALHSQCIERSPDVMLMMYRLTDENVEEFGFYTEATAQPVDQLEDGHTRYRADVKRAWINDERHIKRELDLSLLQS